MDTLRAICAVADDSPATRRAARVVAVQAMLQKGIFDARRVRCIGQVNVDEHPDSRFIGFEVEAVPVGAP